MEDQEKDFIKGFNAGYQLKKYDSDLFDRINNSKNNQTEYFKGMSLGAKQFDQEKLLEEIKKSQQRNQERGRML